jgi:hypothetical protein
MDFKRRLTEGYIGQDFGHKVICSPTKFTTPLLVLMVPFFSLPFLCFFFPSTSLFFLPSALSWLFSGTNYTWRTLTMAAKGKSSHPQIAQIFFNVQTPPFYERTDLEKSLIFLEPIFLVNGMDNSISNLTQTQKCYLPIDWYLESPSALNYSSFFIPLQLVAFWGLLGAFTAAYGIKVLVSEYQLIDMHCIVLPVKFDGGLHILN